MATNIPPAAEPRPRAARAIAAVAVAAGLLTCTIQYMRASSAVAATEAYDATAVRSDRSLDDGTLARAISARPLRQSLFHAAMIRGGHGTDPRWLGVLQRLGWRHTPSLQAIMTRMVQVNDVAGTLVVLDALLRRGQLFNESSAALRMMEAIPDGRPYVLRLLQKRPPWRHDYLLMAADLKTRDGAIGRFEILRELRRRGDMLTRDEVAPLVNVLTRAEASDQAWALWQQFVGTKAATSPLNDADFRMAANLAGDEEISVPFEWQIATGHGFSSEPYLDGGKPRLGISWDGRGLPVFASQRTSARPGAYRLAVSTPDTAATVGRLISFRLRCDTGDVTEFRPSGTVNRALVYRVDIPAGCAFPMFEIAGRLQASASSHSVSLDRVAMTPVPSAGSRVAPRGVE